MADYEVGDRVRVTNVFTDDAGTAADPTTVIFEYKKPGSASAALTYGTDPEVVKESTGVYHCDLDLDIDGMWYVYFTGTGAIVAAAQDNFRVKRKFT